MDLVVWQKSMDLVVWQKSMDLVVACYQITDEFPKTEILRKSVEKKFAPKSPTPDP
jgi:hypothetical protein